ncbi:MAG: hypothetical protein AAB855_00020 [Patescibacteria group bacterium]
MKEANEPGSHIYDLPEDQKGNPEIFAIEKTLQEIRLKYFLPIGDAATTDRDQLEDQCNLLHTEITRAIVQLEALDFDPDEVDAVIFCLDVLNAIATLIVQITERLSDPSVPFQAVKEFVTAINSLMLSTKNLFDIPQSILFLINAGRGETLGLDRSVVQTDGTFGQYGKQSLSASELRALLKDAHHTIMTVHPTDISEQRIHAQRAGESINQVLTAINGAFDFEQIGGRLQRAFHFIGAKQIAALKELIALYDFPKDMFYTARETKGYQQEPIGGSNKFPRLGLGRLLQHIEQSIDLLNLAQRAADRHTKTST